jgi:hypothetical protein
VTGHLSITFSPLSTRIILGLLNRGEESRERAKPNIGKKMKNFIEAAELLLPALPS